MVRVAVTSLYVPLAFLACIRTTLPFPFPEVVCVLMMYVSVDGGEALVMLFRWLVFAFGNGWSQMSSMKVPCPEMEVESVRSLHGHVNWWMWSVSLLRVLWWFLFFMYSYLLRTFSSYMPLFFVCNMLFIHNTCFFCSFLCLPILDTGFHVTFFKNVFNGAASVLKVK